MILVFVCYAAALLAAHRVASRLAQDTPLHLIGLTLLLFAVNLILPVIYAGVVGQLNAAGLLIAGLLLWGGEIALAGRLRPLPPIMTSGQDRRWLLLRRTALLIGVLVPAAVMLVFTLRIVRQLGPIAHVDVAWHYLPNMINLVQSGTLHHFNGLTAYFPAAFESLFAWELVFTSSFRLIPFFNVLAFATAVAFAMLNLQLLLCRRGVVSRDLLTALLLLLVSTTPEIIGTVLASGKNDIFLAAGATVLVYYWLRFWFVGRDWRALALVGVAGGLLLSTKLTGALWLTALAALHVLALGASEPRARWLPTLLRHGLIAGVPFAILLLPWVLRVALDPSAIVQNADATAIANQYTIARLWQHPLFRLHDSRWPPIITLILVANAGLLFLMALRRRYIKGIVLMAVLLVVGLWLQALDVYIWQHFGLYVTVILSGIMLLVVWVRARSAEALAAAGVVAMSLLVMVLFTVFPYSAWIYEQPLVGYTSIAVQYRITLAVYMLYLIGQMTLIGFASSKPQPEIELQLVKPKSSLWHAAPLLVVVCLGFALFALIGDTAVLWRYLGDFTGRSGHTSLFFERFNTTIGHSRIYSLNAPPVALYGQDLSNHVYYVTPGHHGYYGDQAYRWDEVSNLIADLQIDYIVVSFNYPEVSMSALMPTPEVLAEIAKMREHLTVVYEDEQVTLFATENADPLPDALALNGES